MRVGCVYTRALRLRADSYYLHVPRDNLGRPTCGSQLSVHTQSTSVHLQKVFAHPCDALSTNRSKETGVFMNGVLTYTSLWKQIQRHHL